MIYKRDAKGIKALKDFCKMFRHHVIKVDRYNNQVRWIVDRDNIPADFYIGGNRFMYYTTGGDYEA